jgi:hypothetical protein
MTRRRIALIAAVVVAVVVGAIATSRQANRVAEAGVRGYELAEIGRSETDVVAAIEMPSSPHAISGLERGFLRLVAEDGVAHFRNDEVTTERRGDGSVLYRRQSDGQVVGWVRWWDTPQHSLVVVFGPDGKVIGRTLYEEGGLQRRGWRERFVDWIRRLF